MNMTTTQQQTEPALRFPEFSGEWKKHTLLGLSKDGFSNGVFNDPKKVGSGYKLINVKDMYQGNEINIEKLTLLDISKEEFERNKVNWGDILFTRSSLVKEGIAHSCVFLSDDELTTYDGHLIKMSPDRDLVDPQYLGFALVTDFARRQLVARGKTTTMTTIGQEDISSVAIILGLPKEQQKIASFLSTVDTKIEQLSRKKTLLEQYKKGIMQKLFSQEIRFKDDKGNDYPDWEEKRLGDVAAFSKGKGISKADIAEDGYNKCIRYGELYTEYKEVIVKVVSRTNAEKDKSILSEKNDILMPTSDVTPNGLATASALDEAGVILGGDILIIRSDEILNQYFCYYVSLYKTDIMRLVSGVTVYHIYGSDMATLKMSIPPMKEQQKIANFLSAIDQKIDLIVTEIETAQTFKKGLLQQMFL